MELIIGKDFPKKVIPLIDFAKSSIDIIVFDWRWYPQDPGASVQLFNQSIVRASRRGVKIRAITNNDQINNTLKEVGCLARRLSVKNLVHCKFMIIDNSLIIIGSHNYTQSAFQMNLEVSALLNDETTASELKTFFDNLWQN